MINLSPDSEYKKRKVEPVKGIIVSEKETSPSSTPVYRKRRNLHLMGTGKYCPDCGGLCGNSNHSRRW